MKKTRNKKSRDTVPLSESLHKNIHELLFLYFFGEHCVHVAHLLILRDVRIRNRRAEIKSKTLNVFLNNFMYTQGKFWKKATRSILRSSGRKQAEAGNQCRPLSVIGGAVASARGDHLEPANGCSPARSPSSTGFSEEKKSRIMFFCTLSIIYFPKNLLASIDALFKILLPHVAPFEL